MYYIWSYDNHRKATAASAKADNAKLQASQVATEVASLQKELDRVSIACQGMWELLREHTGFTEEMLMERIHEIDLRDGVADGKMGAATYPCPNCGQKTNSKRSFCLMCGEALASPHVVQSGPGKARH